MNFSEIRVEVHCDLWSNLLSKLSERGLADLEMAIVAERFRRARGQGISQFDCLWEEYQSTGTYRDMLRWLKHRAYCGVVENQWREESA